MTVSDVDTGEVYWQHVLEPVSGYLWLGVVLGNNKLQTGQAFNFGPGADVIQPVSVLIETFTKYWDIAKWTIKNENSGKKERTQTAGKRDRQTGPKSNYSTRQTKSIRKRRPCNRNPIATIHRTAAWCGAAANGNREITV